MDGYQKLVAQALTIVGEVFPWDLEEEIKYNADLILLDIREQDEFDMMHIKHSIHVPRGVLEGACVWNYDDTVPKLVQAREQNIVVICRSGNRSALAAFTMQKMGFTKMRSLKMGIKGWNDNDFEMVNVNHAIVDIDQADKWLNRAVSEDKLTPFKNNVN
ncbi:rhodanese domain protein [Abyssogena phaseoliformis symbiont OG214]|uniref:rhodanese-like domain-containing protein n=1 Tax=Abyssogena phaseoliformis symbiont TaxID=596095 RepID=UPI00191519D3|nr:rhodanese-like domain-containing protein [Abyssogena phaseoliformis symbiont]MBW5288613.1 Rhodanese-related sulfurtransferase [Candidatus Ruthia sp. Apha_13_S6]BBB23301.1 rhodanese domain protein [Abyssogena phaseoliformis symbiont OG214]